MVNSVLNHKSRWFFFVKKQIFKLSKSERNHSTANNKSNSPSIREKLSQQTSEKYLTFISNKLLVNEIKEPTIKTGINYVKLEILEYLNNRNISKLIEIFKDFVSNRKKKQTFFNEFDKQEITFYFSKLIDFQIALINDHASIKSLIKLGKNVDRFSNHEAQKHLKEIRKIYSLLIYDSPYESFYDQDKEYDIYNSNFLTGFRLSIGDYESLVKMEAFNFNFDFAEKWLKQFEKSFPDYNDLMTYNLWILKLKITCKGAPQMWSKIYESNKYSDMFKTKILFHKTLKDLHNAEKKRKNNDLVYETFFNETIIYIMGYLGNIDFLKNYIKKKWFIDSNGNYNLVNKPLSTDDPLYPNLKILKAIFVSFYYNNLFVLGLNYVNFFQKYYPAIETSLTATSNYKVLWNHIFKCANDHSFFTESDVLKNFLVSVNSPKIYKSVADALTDSNFSFKKFDIFYTQLKKNRYNLINSLWSAFHRQFSFYSNEIYTTYLFFLSENLSPETIDADFTDLLSKLKLNALYFSISDFSFNKRSSYAFHPVALVNESILLVYESAIKLYISLKLSVVSDLFIKSFIKKWSLDHKMANKMNSFFLSLSHQNLSDLSLPIQNILFNHDNSLSFLEMNLIE